MKKTFVYISCWTHMGGAPGIGIYEYNNENGQLNPIDVVRKDLSCGVTYYDRKREILYICVETEDHPAFRKGGGGRVIAFSVNQETGYLKEIDEIATLCPNPSYVTQDLEGQYLIVSNHSSYNTATKVVKGEDGKYHCMVVEDDSTVDLIMLNSDGTFIEIADVAFHYGWSQKKFKPHPHCAIMSPSGNFYVVCDKGNDKIYTYSIDRKNNKLKLCCEPFQDISGSSPRYCCFHPTLPYLYVNHERVPNLAVFRYDEKGYLTLVSYIDSIPKGINFPNDKGHSGILMDSSGKYLHTLLPSTAAISTFKVDEENGMPELIKYQQSDENKLRAFALSPDSRYMIVTCIQSGAVKTYKIDTNGCPVATGFKVVLKGAAFVTFVETK